jgi:uncharacterized membrane protein YbhN (UPF0104 family)
MKLKIAAVLVVTVLCLVWVLWGIDPAVVAVSLGDFRWGYLGIVFVCYAAAHSLRVVRLRTILGRPVPFVRLLSILSIGYLAINVVPLRMGEFVRPTLLAEKEQIPFGAGLAAIFIERLVDMFMLLGMMLLVGFVVDLPEGRIVVEGIDVLRAGQRAVGTLVALGTVGLVVLLVVGDPILRLTDRLPLGNFLRRFHEGIRALARRPAALAEVLVTSVVIWGITILAVYVHLAAFPGLPVSLGNALTVWSVTLAGMTVAPTPGFFGGFEAFCSAGLVMLGADADRARTFAVLLHLGQFGFTVGAGLFFLVWEGLSLREVVGRSRASATQGAA